MNQEEYVFTPKGYEVLLKEIEQTEERMNESMRARTEAGAGQDDWHDEGYQRAMVDEEMWAKRLAELQSIRSLANIVEPQEQTERVEIGNGVAVQYDDGTVLKFILEGCVLRGIKGVTFVSIHSPLGKTIIGARQNETRIFQGAKKTRIITIKKILPPSRASEIFATN